MCACVCMCVYVCVCACVCVRAEVVTGKEGRKDKGGGDKDREVKTVVREKLCIRMCVRHQVPRLPRETKVGVVMGHACHTNSRDGHRVHTRTPHKDVGKNTKHRSRRDR